MAAAARYVTERRLPQHYERQIRPLRDQLRARILAEVPYSSINSPATHCLPHLLNASFQAAEGESIQLYLDAAGIAVSTGSACAAGDIQPSHVLMAARHDAEVAHSSIRFSLGPDTTPAETAKEAKTEEKAASGKVSEPEKSAAAESGNGEKK